MSKKKITSVNELPQEIFDQVLSYAIGLVSVGDDGNHATGSDPDSSYGTMLEQYENLSNAKPHEDPNNYMYIWQRFEHDSTEEILEHINGSFEVLGLLAVKIYNSALD